MPAPDKPFDVFISHSSQDAQAASEIKQHLQACGLKCWKAPDDVNPGESWPSAITRALAVCRVMVLVWSRNSLASREVSKELTIAMRNGLTVIPFRIEDVQPTGEWDYHLANTHWMDAFPGDLAPFVALLATRIPSFIANPAAPAAPLPHAPARGMGIGVARDRSGSRSPVAATILGSLLVIGALGALFLMRGPGEGKQPAVLMAEGAPDNAQEIATLRKDAEQAQREKDEALRQVREKEAESLRQIAQRAEAEKQLALQRATQAEEVAKAAQMRAANESFASISREKLVDVSGHASSLGTVANVDSPSLGVWLFPESSLRLLEESELQRLNQDELWRARNEIFARRGYIFQSNRGKALARSLGAAYNPVSSAQTAIISAMNPVERANIERISRFETTSGP